MLSVLAMVASVPSVAYAANIDTVGGSGSSTVVLDVEAATFDVTVPTALPIYVDSEGIVTTADDTKIVNNGFGSIIVSGLTVAAKNDWTVVGYSNDLSNALVNTREFGMIINSETTTDNGSITFNADNWPVISGSNNSDTDEFPIIYSAIIAPQSDALDTDIAEVVFTIDWNMGINIEDYYTFVDDKSNSGGWKLGLTEDFKNALNQAEPTDYESWQAGTPLPAFPEEYNGIPVTSLNSMFRDCRNMKTVDVSAWDTSEITEMNQMFSNCTSLKTLDLSTWNFSSATDATDMFTGSANNLEKIYIDSATTVDTSFMLDSGTYRYCVKMDEGDLTYIAIGKVSNKYLGFWAMPWLTWKEWFETEYSDGFEIDGSNVSMSGYYGYASGTRVKLTDYMNVSPSIKYGLTGGELEPGDPYHSYLVYWTA